MLGEQPSPLMPLHAALGRSKCSKHLVSLVSMLLVPGLQALQQMLRVLLKGHGENLLGNPGSTRRRSIWSVARCFVCMRSG